MQLNDPWSDRVIKHVLSKLSSQIFANMGIETLKTMQCHYNLRPQSNHQVKPSRTCDFNICSGYNNNMAVVPSIFRLSLSPARYRLNLFLLYDYNTQNTASVAYIHAGDLILCRLLVRL